MTIINPQDMTKTYRIVLPDGTPDTVTIEKFEVLGRSARIWFKVGAGWAFTVMGSILPGRAGSVLARNGADAMEILLGPEPIRATDSMGNVYVIRSNGLQITTTPDGQEFIIDAWERELPPVVATPDAPPVPEPAPPQPMPEPAPPVSQPVDPAPAPAPLPAPAPEVPSAPPVVADPAPPVPEPPVQLPPRFEEDPERPGRGGMFPRRPRQRE